MTNATKALVITLVNSVLTLVTAFGVSLNDAQTGAIALTVNSGLALWVALTYRDSPKRVP